MSKHHQKHAANARILHWLARSCGCKNTIEESFSDESVFQRQNTRNPRESGNVTLTHLHRHTCHSSDIHVTGVHKKCFSAQWRDITSELQFCAWRCTGSQSQSAHVIQWTLSSQGFFWTSRAGNPVMNSFCPSCRMRHRNLRFSLASWSPRLLLLTPIPTFAEIACWCDVEERDDVAGPHTF